MSGGTAGMRSPLRIRGGFTPMIVPRDGGCASAISPPDQHVVVLPLLREHDHHDFEIFCYADVLAADAVTEEFQIA